MLPLVIAPVFGLAMAGSYALGWMVLDRAFTGRTATTLVYIALAAAGSAMLAQLAAWILDGRRWSARFAASLVILFVGTFGIASFLIALQAAWASHPLPELPLHIVGLILAIVGAASLYGFLALAAPLILPLGLPLIVLAALLIARRPR